MKQHFSSSFFAGNRQRLIERLRGGAIALAGYVAVQRINDIAQTFEQESNFWYLTGIEEPGWQVIIDGRRAKAWLVQPAISKEQELFSGCLSRTEAMERSGIGDIVDATEAITLLRQLARTHSLIYTCDQPPAHGYVPNPAQRDFKHLLERHFGSVQDCRQELATLRSIKQPLEIEAIKEAIKITAQAFEAAKQSLPKLRYEYEVEAEFTYTFRKSGRHHAYQPLVANGAHACTLHYDKNAAALKKRSLLLIDIGASYEHYAADITRTYAIGEPTKRQKAVHDAVRQAQQEIIQLCQPGTPLTRYREAADDIMEHYLNDLRLLMPGSERGFYDYFPHAMSHGLGLDVHDSFGSQQYLLPGMVLTVEPGIYITEEGIGVRIEDDIYITEEGPVNLSVQLSTQLN